MGIRSCRVSCLFALLPGFLNAGGTVPTFQHTFGQTSYTLFGHEPASGATATIPTVLVPITLSFEAKKTDGRPFAMDANPDVARVIGSPVFSQFSFPSGGTTQYGDALLRTTFPAATGWHTLLGKPEIHPMTISVPVGFGYILTSKKTGRSFAIADVEFLQQELFKRLPKQAGKLVIAVTHNTAYYALGDATVCCSWGTHGVDSGTGNSFILASYLHSAPPIVEDSDVQPLTQQLAEFVNDPLHDPLAQTGRGAEHPGNNVPAWMRTVSSTVGGDAICGGTGVGSTYFLLQPTDTNPKNNFPASKAFVARVDGATYHLQNVALLPWYTRAAEGTSTTYSFPDTQALSEPSKPCPARHGAVLAQKPTVTPLPMNSQSNGHWLIGYWDGGVLLFREISPQWDVIIVAFATPAKSGPEGSLYFQSPAGIDAEQFKADIAYTKSRGKKVMISLGGGGQYFALADPKHVPNFVSSVTSIVSEYGFDGVDIDFESPSLTIDRGDTDFKHPTTPSIVNLISALRQLHDHFGPGFMISLVPEGTQIPAGYPSYGGQFGSYLPIAYALRDILSFVDVQDYNTPPLEGLDGEIYQSGSVDYHAAMTELLLHGFNVRGDPNHFFPPMPADKVAIGFLTSDTTPTIVSDAMDYVISGKAPQGTTYKLLTPGGYPGMIGAMFWTIDADRRENYKFSNVIGPQLHRYEKASK